MHANVVAFSTPQRLPFTVRVARSERELRQAVHIRHAAYARHVPALAAHPRAARLLCVEITESVALHDLAHTRRFIERLRGCGARVALDDFGAGYTSFSYLKELPADALKIDGQFVRGLHAHPANLAIIEAIAELARNLGMQTIAEWAEDLATVEALHAAGIDYVQGYVIARPQPPERILAAESAAAFIEDQAVARFVGQALRPPHERRGAVL